MRDGAKCGEHGRLMPVYDIELETRDLQGLSSIDAVVGLFS